MDRRASSPRRPSMLTDGGQAPSGQVSTWSIAVGVAGDRSNHREIVDDAAEQDAAVQRARVPAPPRPRRIGIELARAFPKPREHRGVDIVGRRQQVGVRELALARRVQDGHLDRPQRPHGRVRVPGDPDRFLDGGIEQLHVPDHQPFAVVIRPLDGRQAIGLGTRRGQGLLGKHR